MKKIFVTGGHYTPAAAVIEFLLKRGDWDIFYIGKKHSFEGDEGLSYEYLELKDDPKIKFLNITAGRLQARFSENILQSVLALLKIPVGFCLSAFWIVKYRPNLVLSFGGYIALPVVIMAWLAGIPVVTHEQTKVFGLANKIIQLFAERICVSFRSTMPKENSDRWIFTGNPIRRKFLAVSNTLELSKLTAVKKKVKKPVVYVTGGKQGSHAINEEILKLLPDLASSFVLIIQTGDNRQFDDFSRFNLAKSQLPPELSERVLVSKFFGSDEIGAVFNLADFVVSRSGANVVFDLASVGKPSILIPLPASRHNEQFLNAEELENRGLAKIVKQENIQTLSQEIKNMAMSLSEYQKNRLAGLDLIVSDSAEKIADIVVSRAI